MTAITPFTIAIPEGELADLRARIRSARWARPAPVADWSRGVPLDYLKGLAAYWADGFDWRKEERALNAFPQFTIEVDGQTMHFVHIRSAKPDALPVILCHGWPGSFVEFQLIIGPLSQDFHVVVPSLPGFGFSVPLSSPGWDLSRTTHAYAAIMERLGYDKYAAHGSDIGAGIAGHLASYFPDRVVAVHTASEKAAAAFFGMFIPMPQNASDADRAALEKIRASRAELDGYSRQQGTRPQTLAYGLGDSPVGQLAWIVEKFAEWTNPAHALPDQAVDRDQLLTNVSLYWFTNTAGSSAQFYYESQHSRAGWTAPSSAPTGYSVFDTDPLMRRLMNPVGKAAFWAEHAEGGHFPAMEAPELLAADLKAFLATIR
jgi:pimeloyl-ACP methyl ester carboxylesterase